MSYRPDYIVIFSSMYKDGTIRGLQSNPGGGDVLEYIWYTGMCRRKRVIFFRTNPKNGVGFWAGKTLNTGQFLDFSPDKIPKNGSEIPNFEFSGEDFPPKWPLKTGRGFASWAAHPAKPNSITPPRQSRLTQTRATECTRSRAHCTRRTTTEWLKI